MPAGRFRPVANDKPAPHRPAPTQSQRAAQHYALGPRAAGGAALTRGTFQPSNRRQQRQLHADVVAEANRLERVHQAQRAHVQAQRLYRQGKHKEALALNAHARQMAGLAPTDAGVVGNVIENTARDLGTMAIYSPAGIYQVGKGTAQDVNAARRGDLSFRHTRAIGAATARGFKQDIQHPLRHPGFTLLDVFGAASLGTGAVARGLGAASRVGIGGERVAAAARAFDPAVPRTIRVGDLEAHPPTSRNRAVLLAQRAHDRALSGTARAPYSARGLAQRQLLPRRMGFELEQTRRIDEAVQRAPAGGLAAAGRKLSTPQQIALRSVAEETPIETQVAFHRNRIKSLRGNAPRTALERRRHQKQIVLLRRAEQYVGDEKGVPVLKHPELQAIYDTAAAVAKNRDELLYRVGRLTPDAGRGRVAAPGKLYRGESLNGASGSPQLRLPETRGFASVEATARRIRPQRFQVARPRTAEEAQRRLNALDRQDEALMAKVAERTGHPYLDKTFAAREQLRRNKINGLIARFEATGKRRAGTAKALRAGRQRSVADEVFQHASDQIDALIANQPNHPVVRAYLSRQAEKEQLRASLQPEFGEQHGPLGTVNETRTSFQPVRGRPASAPFEGGQFRVPHVGKRAPRSLGQHGQMGSADSIGIPRAPGSVTHEFTGALQTHARMRQNTTRLVAESNLEAQRYGALLRARDQFKKAAHDQPGPNDVPIRMDALKQHPIPQEAKQYLERVQRKAEEGVKLSGQERAQLSHAYDHIHRELFPGDPAALSTEEQARFAELARQGKIKWVDRRLLRGLDKPRPLATLGAHQTLRVASDIPRAINQASRAAILYLKPAYAIPNMVGNAALNIVQQGFGAPRNIARSVQWWHALDHETRSGVMASVGEGIAQSLAGSGGVGQKAIQGAANVWSKAVDAPFRWNAFVYEAKRAGIRSPQKLEALHRRIVTGTATDAERLKFETAARKANAAMIDYGRLGPVERDIIRNVVFFYPWVKGSTLFAGHFLREHPAQAAVLGQLGKQGKAQAQADLGPVPSYAEGLFKVGGSKKTPLVVNPASTSILQTPAQVGQAVGAFATGHVRKADNPLSFLTPALSAAEAAVTRRDPLTGRELKGSGFGILARELTGGLPQVTLAQRLGLISGHKSKLYPMTGRQAVGQFVLGGIFPRNLDRPTANDLAKQERLSLLSPMQRFSTQSKDARKTILAAARKQDPQAAPVLDREWKLYNERVGAYKKAGARDQLERYRVDVQLLRKRGAITDAEAKEGLTWAQSATSDAIEKQRRLISTRAFGTPNLNYAAKQLGVTLPR